ncbi:MAG: MMPL family transporter [Lachnospiraceae bacterium]|nr:MMPL family transporter [Lachnospiraceae bacterium]
MQKALSKGIVKHRKLILLIALLLLIPSVLLYFRTGVNYDLLSYLPQDIDTMKGQQILVDEFGTGAFSMVVVEGMEEKDVSALKSRIEKVGHVKKVLWYDSVMDLSVPMELLPEDIYQMFNNGDATEMFVLFDDTSSSDAVIGAVRDIRKLCDRQCFVSGMSGILADTEDLTDSETPVYVGLAVICSVIVLSLTMDSFLAPFLFLASIGMAIVYNMGSNYFLGSVSYVTKALAAVLQLGVTMDYSIFLWHSYEEQKSRYKDHEEAMECAISDTFTSVLGSSITTVAGFVALCFMSFTLGLDIGIVMSKGVLIGVISCVTILPSLILVCDKLLEKTSHKPLIPEFTRLGGFVMKFHIPLLILYLILLVPAIYGNDHVGVYYNLDSTLPESLPSITANKKLSELFNTGSTHMLMLPADTDERDVRKLAKDIEAMDGVKYALGFNTVKAAGIPAELIPDKAKEALINDNWQIMLIGSEFKVASPEVGRQCDAISAAAKEIADGSMLVGEAPGTADLIKTTDKDFTTVNTASIGIVFVIIMLVFRSLSIPVILVAVIEGGIFMNMSVPYFTGTTIPFVASIVIGTIQLGATVDYAILMTNRYLKERRSGLDKKAALTTAVRTSAKSIFTSAMSFFAATFGVGVYSNIDMISALCILMARGAIVSMLCVIFVLPSFLMLFDRVIMHKTVKKASRDMHSGNDRRLKLSF